MVFFLHLTHSNSCCKSKSKKYANREKGTSSCIHFPSLQMHYNLSVEPLKYCDRGCVEPSYCCILSCEDQRSHSFIQQSCSGHLLRACQMLEQEQQNCPWNRKLGVGDAQRGVWDLGELLSFAAGGLLWGWESTRAWGHV